METLKRARSAAQLQILKRYSPDLMQYINIRSLLPHLQANCLVTDEDVSYLTNSHKTEQDRIEYLLSKIPRNGPSTFDRFVECLRGERGHSGHQYLAKQLRAANERIKQDSLAGKYVGYIPYCPL